VEVNKNSLHQYVKLIAADQSPGGGSMTEMLIYGGILVMLTSLYWRLFSPSCRYILGLNRRPRDLTHKTTASTVSFYR